MKQNLKEFAQNLTEENKLTQNEQQQTQGGFWPVVIFVGSIALGEAASWGSKKAIQWYKKRGC